MPTKSPHKSRQRRRSPARQRKLSKTGTSTRGRSSASRLRRRTTKSRSSSTVRTTGRSVTVHITVPRPPAPSHVIAAVREELDRLSQRWKGLLPRIKKSIAAKSKSAKPAMMPM